MTTSSSDIFSVPFVGDINKNYSNLFRLTPIPVNKITVTTPDLLPASTHLLFSRDTVKTRTDPNDTGAGTLQSLETTKQRSRLRPAWSVTGVATGGIADQLESDLSLTLDNAFTTHRESTDTPPTSDTSRLGFLLRATHAIPIGNSYQHLQPSMIADINYVHGINADAESSIHCEHHSTDKSCEYRLRMPTSTVSAGLLHDVSSKVHRAFLGGTYGVWRDGINDAVVGAKITSTPFLTQFQRWDHSPIIPVTSSTTSSAGQHLIPGIESMAVTGLLRHPSTNLTFDTNLEISGADLHLKDWHIRGSYQQEKWCGGLQVGIPPDPADVRTGTTLAQKLNTIGSWPLVTGDLLYNITPNDTFRVRASSDASMSYLYRRVLSPSLSVSTNVNIHPGKGGNEATLGVGVFVG